jgi:hypothetical protein
MLRFLRELFGRFRHRHQHTITRAMDREFSAPSYRAAMSVVEIKRPADRVVAVVGGAIRHRRWEGTAPEQPYYRWLSKSSRCVFHGCAKAISSQSKFL